MSDLDQAIRAQIQTYDLTMDGRRMLKAAIIAVLDLHRRESADVDRDPHLTAQCASCTNVDHAVGWPCREIDVIRAALGLTQETTP